MIKEFKNAVPWTYVISDNSGVGIALNVFQKRIIKEKSNRILSSKSNLEKR